MDDSPDIISDISLLDRLLASVLSPMTQTILYEIFFPIMTEVLKYKPQSYLIALHF